MPRIIYGLVDPRSHQIRYIGKSKIGVRRAKQHAMPSRLTRDRTHKGNWIRQLVSHGLSYGIEVLEEDVLDLTGREQEWIAYGLALGWPLTNLTCGGEPGPDGCKLTSEHRDKISRSNKGRKLTHSQRKRFLCAVRSGRTSAQAQNAGKASAAWRGRHHTTEARRKISIGQVGKKMSLAGREKIRRTNSRPIRDLTTGTIYASIKEAAEEIGLCRRSISRVLRGQFRQTAGRRFEHINA